MGLPRIPSFSKMLSCSLLTWFTLLISAADFGTLFPAVTNHSIKTYPIAAPVQSGRELIHISSSSGE